MSPRQLIKALLPRKVREVCIRAAGSLFLDKWSLERLAREDFMIRAFRTLTYNNIDGDYAEFGCHRAISFAMAFHEAARHKHKA